MDPDASADARASLAPDAVEELMAACLDAPEHEWPEALARAERAHPGHAPELRRRLGLLLAHDALPIDAAAATLHLDRVGEFTALEPLGSGGMGLVYRARQESLGRDVALKLIRPERAHMPGVLARFRREVETVARLRHPGIVAIHSVGVTDDGSLPFFAMELLEGATLADALAALRGRAPESLDGADLFEAIGGEGAPPAAFDGDWVEAVLRVVLQVARALQHAHAAGILHRDVKPSNVVLERSGRAVLIDFGLTALESSDAARVTARGAPVGTLVYMPPERLGVVERHDSADVRGDVYALGATLYELLALQAPFTGATLLEIERAVLRGDPDPVRARNREVTRDAANVVAKAMAARPADRYPSVAAFAADLEALLRGAPVAARPPGLIGRVWRGASRRPALATSVALALALFVGVPTYLWWLSTRHRDALGARLAEERRAKDEALAANLELEDVVRFTLGMFERADPDLHGGQVPDARELLALGAAELPRLAGRPRSRARIELALGELFGALTDLASAGPHLEAAIAHYEARLAATPDDTLAAGRLARALRHAGHNALMQRDEGAARARLERALALATGLFGGESRELVPYLATLADLAEGFGRADEALPLRARAVAILDGLGEDSAMAARARGLLGVTHAALGDDLAARPALERALATDEAVTPLGAERALFELALGDVLEREGRLDESLALATAARERLEATRGAGDFLTLQARLAEAEALGALGRVADALPAFEALAAAFAAHVPVDHPLVLRARLMQLVCLDGLGRGAEVAPRCAEWDLEPAFARVFGPDDPSTAELRALVARSR